MKKYKLTTPEKTYSFLAQSDNEARRIAKEKLGSLSKTHELKTVSRIPLLSQTLSYWREEEGES